MQAWSYGGPATWCLDLRSGQLQSSAARARMMGYEPAAAGSSSEWWDALLHPDERIAVHTTRARHIQGVGSGYKSLYRAQRRDGSWAWLLEIGCIERDRDQQEIRVFCAAATQGAQSLPGRIEARG